MKNLLRRVAPRRRATVPAAALLVLSLAAGAVVMAAHRNGGTSATRAATASGRGGVIVGTKSGSYYTTRGELGGDYIAVCGEGGEVGVYGVGEIHGVKGIVGSGAGGSETGSGVAGESPNAPGVYGRSTTASGVQGSSNSGAGVDGWSSSGTGLNGRSTSGRGVWGAGAIGVQGESSIGDGLRGESSANDKSGVYAFNYNASGYAAYFLGNVTITDGTFTKPGGSFRIDHPLEPEAKYLSHSFVESPDMKNVYDGVVELDAFGEATVELPAWFEALNREFRYQLTPLGVAMPELHVATEVADNRFAVAGGVPGERVSWQLTGVRKDPWAEAHRIPVEEAKPEAERGTYLHPIEWGQPLARDVEWLRRPDVMARIAAAREAPQNAARAPSGDGATDVGQRRPPADAQRVIETGVAPAVRTASLAASH